MKTWIGSIIPLLLAATSLAEQHVYLSARGDGHLACYSFDAGSGALSLKSNFELKGGPGNSAVSPDGKWIYVSVTSGKGKSSEAGIETLAVQADGSVKHAGYAKTPHRCGYLCLDSKGETLFSSHYGEGRITSYKIENGIYSGTVLDDLVTDERAHCIGIDPSDRFVFVPHTSPNKVYQFQFNHGRLQPLSPAFASGPDEDHRYHQPRHFVFHPKKEMIYTSNERGGGLSHWSYDASGQLSLKQTVCTLPDNPHEKFAASDIAITADGRFVYVANRDGLDRNATEGLDSIAAYALDPPTGAIKNKIGSYAIGRHPRCLRIDCSGQFLFGPGVNSNNLTVYRIDQQTGALRTINTITTGKSPMWVVCLEL